MQPTKSVMKCTNTPVLLPESFDTSVFTTNTEVDESLANLIKERKECIDCLANEIATATDENGYNILESKISHAKLSNKTSTNIFKTGVADRMIKVGDAYVRVDRNDLKRGLIHISETETLSVDKSMGLSIVDLMKKPRNSRNRIPTLGEALYHIIRKKVAEDKKNEYLRTLGEGVNLTDEQLRKNLSEYMKKNNVVIPKVYVRFNRSWDREGGGKFILELDWSGKQNYRRNTK